MFVISGSNGTVGRDAWSNNQFQVKPQLIGSTNPVLRNKYKAGRHLPFGHLPFETLASRDTCHSIHNLNFHAKNVALRTVATGKYSSIGAK